MQTQALPKLLNLPEAYEALGRKISIGAMRAAIKAGDLPCIRIAPTCSARILIDGDDLSRWVNGLRGKSQVVLSVAEVHRLNKAAEDPC